MTSQQPSIDELNLPAVSDVLAMLILHWPNPLTLYPSLLRSDMTHKDFLAAISLLQDLGMIMTEMLLVGNGTEPKAIDVLITRKGQEFIEQSIRLN